MSNNNFKEIFECMKKYDNILIAGHKNPDGDSVGSSVALGLALTNLGKNVTMYMKDLPIEHKILKGTYLYTTTPSDTYDLVIVLDCADDQRFEIKEQFKNAKETINIDHHKDNPMFATWNYADEFASSTCEIVYDFFMENNIEIDKDIAEALFVGIISDTALYQNRNTTSKVYNMSSDLMNKGINFNEIIIKNFFCKQYSELKLHGKAFDNAERYHDGEIIISTLTRDEIKSVNAKSNETSGIISQLRQVEGTKLACFIYEPIPHNVKVSFRCDIPYDVCEIAQRLGGGGHVLAAGAIIKNRSIEDVKKEALELMEEQLQRYEN
ncbi:MAG: bifunctional oligoribonuclease/PAP phosphatase NrnA [Clostridia bacterium]|nr:bifunctional oligoribonuclease/PAP phosphatase NrnA [Clostridia bacterium]